MEGFEIALEALVVICLAYQSVAWLALGFGIAPGIPGVKRWRFLFGALEWQDFGTAPEASVGERQVPVFETSEAEGFGTELEAQTSPLVAETVAVDAVEALVVVVPRFDFVGHIVQAVLVSHGIIPGIAPVAAQVD